MPGRIPSNGLVMRAWCSQACSGAATPAILATWRDHSPAHSATASQARCPRGVPMPVTRPLATLKPVTGVSSKARRPCRRAARIKAAQVSEALTRPSPGEGMPATTPSVFSSGPRRPPLAQVVFLGGSPGERPHDA